MPLPKQFSKKELQQMKTLYENGMTARDIGKKFYCSDSTIRKYLIRGYVKLRGRGLPYPIQKKELKILYEKGFTASQIAENFKCHPDVIYKRLKNFNIPRFNGRLKPLSINVPSDPVILAYLAGIIDGEGTIEVFHDGNKSQTMRPHLTIANTHLGLLKYLVKTVGGGYSQNSTPSHCKQGYHWSLYRASDILALTTAILPYLIIKKEGAERVIQKCEELNQTRVYSIE